MAGKPAGAGDLSCEREAEGGATRVNPSRETAKGHKRHRDSLERLQRGKTERHTIDIGSLIFSSLIQWPRLLDMGPRIQERLETEVSFVS